MSLEIAVRALQALRDCADRHQDISYMPYVLDTARNALDDLARLEGMAAPGHATERAREIGNQVLQAWTPESDNVRPTDLRALQDAMTRCFAASLTATEDGARRAALIDSAHVVRAQQDSEHPATYGEIAKAIMALAEATPAK